MPAGRLRIDQWIARQDAQAKPARTATDCTPDATESDQTQSLAGKAPHALDFIPAPAVAGLHLVMVREQLTIEDEEQRERVVRDFVGAVLPDAAHANSVLRRGADIDAVPAGGRHRNDAAARETLEHRAVEWNVVRQDRIGIATGVDERVPVAVVGEVLDARAG